jgi:hypothetical protein
MKKIYYLLLPLILMLSTCEKKDDSVKIPDEMFIEFLQREGYDRDGNGIITHDEVDMIDTLIFPLHIPIRDYTGIEKFVQLRYLDFGTNRVGTLDASKLTKLEVLLCAGCSLSSLNISGCIALKRLDCGYWDMYGGNFIDELNLSNCTKIEYLNCSGNNLTSLDISNCKELVTISAGDGGRYWDYKNQISHLDISNNTKLKRLVCANNQLTNLDLSNNVVLEFLYCSKNLLTSLDVTNNYLLEDLWCGANQLTNIILGDKPALKLFSCDYYVDPYWLDIYSDSTNPISSLDISKCTSLTHLFCRDMHTLAEICVWETPFPPDGLQVYTKGSPNVYFTTDCSK